MTVNYMQAAATARGGSFIKLLFRWRGSVWKLVWKELTIFLFVYFNMSVLYRFFLKGNVLGTTFELIVRHCRSLFSQTEPVISFAMGFYVAQIADRWWRIFMTIPWPDSFGLHLCGLLRSRTGEKYTEADRTVRRTVMRYVILTYVLVFRDISERLRRRFPTYNHLVPALMTEVEKTKLENEDIKRAYWLPIEWAIQHLRKCYYRGQLEEYHFSTLCGTVLRYREMMHSILSFDWINVPLVYTQVVHICICAYFSIKCFSNQPIYEEGEKTWINDFVIPLYAIFEFVFFVGWLKVAQVMLNPFGMDEDDFEIDGLVERNLQVGYSYVDTMFDRLPPLVYVDVTTLPHTKASMALLPKATPMVGSVAHVHVPRAEQRIISKEDLEKIRKLLGPTFGSRYASRRSDMGSLAEDVPQLAVGSREMLLPKTDVKPQVTQVEDSREMTRQSVSKNYTAKTPENLLKPAASAAKSTRKKSSKRKALSSIQQKEFELDQTQNTSESKPPSTPNKIITIQMQRTQDSTREKAERAMKKLKSAPTSAVSSTKTQKSKGTLETARTPYSTLSKRISFGQFSREARAYSVDKTLTGLPATVKSKKYHVSRYLEDFVLVLNGESHIC
ncbi:unnamed protein product [Cylicocyclus nassatus]|uniref:Bestrophin homolog n=1 Tax=Cylicocyclus nassatus TaxID=53992 RepID=A0AA36DX66_CYLNA|nr:unnamed protein product [Cylicocyclus nassatus]